MATQARRPSGDGTGTGWTASAGNTYDCVSDESDLTWISETSTYSVHSFTYPSFAIDADSINSVTIRIRIKDAGGTNPFRSRITVGGTNYYGTQKEPTASFVNVDQVYATNPKTTAAWTEAEVEGTDGTNDFQEAGVNSRTTVDDTLYVSDLPVIVDYEAAAGGLSIPNAMRAVMF